MSLTLTDRVIIVTGAGRGIGRSHCLELGAHGATVIVNDIDAPADDGNGNLAESVAKEVIAAGGKADSFSCSVSDMEAVKEMVRTTVEKYGRLDGIVNNAGILRDRMVAGMSEEEFDAVIDVHLKGTFVMTSAAVAHWRAESKAGNKVDARIINTTSGTGLFGNVGQANYGAAKAGIANFTTISAMELERYGITVNAVSPIARTRMTEGLASMPERGDAEVDKFDPIHASKVVAWLASEESNWLTGAVFRIDGSTVYRMKPWEIDYARAYYGPESGIEVEKLDDAMRSAYAIRPGGIPKGGITQG